MKLIPNKCGVYDKKDAELFFAKNAKGEACIYLLKIHSGYLSSANTKNNNHALHSPLTPKHGLYKTRIEAFECALKTIIKMNYVGDTVVNKLMNDFMDSL